MATKGASNRYGNTKNGRRGYVTPHTGYPWAKAFNKKTLKAHFLKHGDEVGCNTKEAYAAHAVSFANTINRDRYISHVASNGTTYKFDLTTGRFAMITKHGIVITYFKPKNGYQYYLDNIGAQKK